MSGLIILGLVLLVYFIPTMIASNRKNIATILVINLFLGWTFIGWVVALAMAVHKK